MTKPIYADSRPYVRWWWFESEIRESDIAYQLEWLHDQGFGGVELSFQGPAEGSHGEPPPFLSPDWTACVRQAREHARRLGIGFDVTFGTQWPFGGDFVPVEDAAMTHAGPSPYRLRKYWHSTPGAVPFVINHLERDCLERYAEKMLSALRPALDDAPTAFFCDSWEIPSGNLWTPGFSERFLDRFGYDIDHLMNHLEYHTHARYDYRKLLADYVIEEFYAPFTRICHDAGTLSRVQCHGAPTDLVYAYANTDIPETETMLFDPSFAQFASSAAVLQGLPRVTAESFTALYGLSRNEPPGFEREPPADIKLVADAMIANGVNQVVWHGMPFNGPTGKNRFNATTYVGPGCMFSDELPALNAYMQRVCAYMSEGTPYTDVAVYLPLEDNWLRHLLPETVMRPSAHYYWELQYQHLPEQLRGYRPHWISKGFLLECENDGSGFRYRDARFSLLWVDVEWLDLEALREIYRLASAGTAVCLVRAPRQPGYRRWEEYDKLMESLTRQPNVRQELKALCQHPPLIEGADIPEFWVRCVDDELLIFFAHPKSLDLAYPMTIGQSLCDETVVRDLQLNAFAREIPLKLEFAPYQSLLMRIAPSGKIREENIAYEPPPPPRESGSFTPDHRYPGYFLAE